MAFGHARKGRNSLILIHMTETSGSQEIPSPIVISNKGPAPEMAPNWSIGVRSQVAEAMMQNAREVVPNIPWEDIFNRLVTKRNLKGEENFSKVALAESIGGHVASIAAHLQWSLHAPEMVFISTYHFQWIIEERISQYDTSAKELEKSDPVINGPAVEARRAKAAELQVYRNRIHEKLEQYISENPRLTPDYQELLKRLLYKQVTRYGRLKIYQLIKENKITEALNLTVPSAGPVRKK